MAFIFQQAYMSLIKGHLAVHSDSHGKQPILHYMLPYSFKKVDYETGGLVCEDNKGQMHDIEL